MKVAIVTHRFSPAQGGVETYVRNLSSGLVDDGYDVTIFATDIFSCAPFVRFSMRNMERGISWARIRTFWATKPLRGIEATAIAPFMIGDLIKEDFDVIHAQNYVYFPAYASAFVNLIKKIPFVLTAHSSARSAVPKAVRRLYDFTLGKFALSMIDHVIALTQKEKKYLEALGVPDNEVSVIPHGIDLKKFMNPPNPNDFREKYNVTGSIVLFVGRLAPRHKGLPFLVKAIPIVSKEEPNTTFVFVGPDAGIKTELVKLSHKLGVNRKTMFLGTVDDDDLVKAYHACDLFVLPSILEPFGIVLLEAMASGKPIVASDIDGIPEVVRHGENGLLVPPRDVNRLASAIITLLQDACMAKQIKKNNVLKARSYSLKKVIKATEKVYEMVSR